MGHFLWISGAAASAVVLLAIAVTSDKREDAPSGSYLSAYAEPEVRETLEFNHRNDGSALATAAFGLSALQPETYNGQIVQDIIEASPLAYGEKDRLIAKLHAAEAGNAELPRVLTDIRVSLAVE